MASPVRPRRAWKTQRATARHADSERNRLQPGDLPVHDWYRFVLSYPPHLVRDYLERFDVGGDGLVLDPFCGTGTTLVECKRAGLSSVGLEPVPMSHFASAVKTDWTPNADKLVDHAERVAVDARDDKTPRDLAPETKKLLLKDSISERPLQAVLALIAALADNDDAGFIAHERLALAKALPTEIGNLRFGPEVGVGTIKEDADVIEPWLTNVRAMAADIEQLSDQNCGPATVFRADARSPMSVLEVGSVSCIITSPPYPNEKDYTRTTRLESALLGFLKDRADLRSMKEGLVRSNTRNVYKADVDDEWVESFRSIQNLARRIEKKRVDMGKSSGFERLYHRVARLYFGGMYRHLAHLRPALRPGARLAYVVGDQASYLRVMIRTGQILAEIAESLGYEVDSIDLFRTRPATATRAQLREEVVVLRWPGA